MVFNDTTNKNGIIQECETWTGLGDGAISGDTTKLKKFTSRLNEAFNRLVPELVTFNTLLRWDDTNHTKLPVGTFNLVSGQSDYTIAQDDSSLDILNIASVRILPYATATQYMDVEIIGLDDRRADEAMNPASTDTGVPFAVLKRGNTLHFIPSPNYNATNGGQIFFDRIPSYFVSSDTTKEPGFPKPFHGILPMMASKDWLVANKPDAAVINELTTQIQTRLSDLRRANRGRYPSRTAATTAPIRFR